MVLLLIAIPVIGLIALTVYAWRDGGQSKADLDSLEYWLKNEWRKGYEE